MRVEVLESRVLLAVTISEFSIPTPQSMPTDITTGPDGNLWFTEEAANKIAELNPTTLAITEFPVPTPHSNPGAITTGPDGNIWFTEFSASKIGRFNPKSHAFTEIGIPGNRPNIPLDITTGPDGNIWFSQVPGQIGQVNVVSGAITLFNLPPTSGDQIPNARGITTGPDGNLWFAATTFKFGSYIGSLNPATHVITTYNVATSPNQITAGPDGNIWFTESSSHVGQFNLTSHVITEFPILSPNPTGGITTGPDGDLWFVEPGENQGKIGRIDPTTHSVVEYSTHYGFPADALAGIGITAGPDGNIWFPEQGDSAIGKVQIADGPTITALQRFGFHMQPTRLVLTFDKALDPTRAQNLANYQLNGPHGRHVPIASVVYDPGSLTVTIAPRRRLDIHRAYRLVVNGTAPGGLTDSSGNLLDGARTGQPGSNFVGTVDRHALVIPTVSGRLGSRRKEHS